MKILPTLFLFFLLISSSSCHDDEHYDIKIKNASDKAVVYAVAMARAQDKYALVGD